jgi:hypothetical protein
LAVWHGAPPYIKKCHYFLEAILPFSERSSFQNLYVLFFLHCPRYNILWTCVFPRNHTPDHNFVRVPDSLFQIVREQFFSRFVPYKLMCLIRYLHCCYITEAYL